MNRHVVIVGVGALGSYLLLFARNVQARFTVIDFDRVEQKNLASQAHTKQTVGRNKAQAVSKTMQGLYGMRVDAIPHRLTADNAKQLLGTADLIIDCVDNGDTRRLIQAFVRDRNVPCLHGALAADGAFGRVVWDEHFKIDDEQVEGEPTCEGGEHLPFITMAASCMATQVRDYLADGVKRNFNLHPNGMVRF